MRCDNHCPRFGAENETINHAIFECSPALQTWAHAVTPTPPSLFSSASQYTNTDYLFLRKNDNEDPEFDKDPHPWILWYIWKACYDKLFIGIVMDPLKLSDMLNLNAMLGLNQIRNKNQWRHKLHNKRNSLRDA